MNLVLFVNVWSLCSLHLGKNAFPFTLRIQMIACNCELSQFCGLNFFGNLLLPTWSLHFLKSTFILTCSRLSIFLSNKLWAFAGGRPSKSQQRLLNHTFTSWSTKSRYKSFFWQDLRVLKYSIKMLTSTDQGTVFTLLHMIFGKRFSPGRLVSRGEGRLQAHHDVLHHSGAGASVQKVVVKKELQLWLTWRCIRESQWLLDLCRWIQRPPWAKWAHNLIKQGTLSC